MISPGIYDLSNEEYHSFPDSYSRSALMELKKSPYHYWSKYLNINGKSEIPSRALVFGAAFHMYLLEPLLFSNHYKVSPPAVLLKDVGREKYEEYKQNKALLMNGDFTIISQEEMDLICSMYKAIKTNSEATGLISNARYETSLFWQDQESGLMLKARPDILHNNMIVDLKTCNDASPHAFQNAMVHNGYHIQGAMIREGWKVLTGEDISTVINICIEKTYPYAIGIYIIDEHALEVGHFEFKRLAQELRRAIDTNEWGCYNPQSIGLPKWGL